MDRTRLLPLATRVAVTVFGLIFVSAGLLAIFNRYQNEYQGISYGHSLPSVPLANELPYGVNVDLIGQDEAVIIDSLRLLRSAGFRWVRQPFHWRDVESSPGSFQWGPWDRIIDLCRTHDLKIIAVLDQPPQWARQDQGILNSPPQRVEDYATFVKAFAERYRGRVDHLQIWDEPNIFPNWGNRPVNAAAYTDLLKQAYRSAKSANGDSVVLTAALAPNAELGGANLSDILFLKDMYRHGARGSFDVLAAEPYGMFTAADDRRVEDSTLNFSRVIALRQVMLDSSDAGTAVWAVEFGWNALPLDWSGQPSIWGGVSEVVQARETARAFVRARDEWPWMGVMCVQGFLPWVEQDDALYGFSIVDRSLRPRPILKAIEGLAQGEQYAGVGYHYVNDPRLEWEGAWRDNGAQRLGAVGSRLVLPFHGTGLDILVDRGPTAGRLAVTIDGRAPNRLKEVGSIGYLDLPATEPKTERVRLADGLDDTAHEAVISVVAMDDLPATEQAVALSGLVVIRESNRAVYLLVFAGLIGATILLLGRLVGLSREPAAMALFARTRQRVGALGMRARRLWAGLSEGHREVAVMAVGAVSTAIACLSLDLRVSVVAGLIMVVLVWWRLDLGLGLLMLALPFYLVPFDLVPVASRPVVSPVEALIIVCSVVWVGRRLWMRRGWADCRFQFEKVDLAVALFVAVALLSVVVAEKPREGLREWRTVVVEPAICYYLVVTSLRGKGLARLVTMLIVGAVAISLVGLFQYVFTDDIITAEGVRRMKALYGSPNNLSLFLGRVVPIVTCLAIWSSSRKPYIGALLVMVPALFLTFSLGGWVGTLSAVVVIAATVGRKALLATVVAVGAGGIALLPILRVERIVSHLSLDTGTSGLRLDIWRASLAMIRDHPLLGVGLDQFLVQYPRYMLPSAWREPNLSHPHNLLLDFWLRSGIVGLAIILWLLGSFFAVAYRLFRQEGEPWRKALALGLLASMVDFIVHGMIDNSYFVVDLAVIFWFSMAAVRILNRERGLA